MAAQPDYPQQLYSVYSRADGLHTEPDPDDEIRYVMSRDAERDQFFFHPGIAGGFLARLYQATGEGEWLELAKEYMRFAEGGERLSVPATARGEGGLGGVGALYADGRE